MNEVSVSNISSNERMTHPLGGSWFMLRALFVAGLLRHSCPESSAHEAAAGCRAIPNAW
jgi:hypothetical protein